MLTIKPTPDYDAILRWNAGKDEAFLFQWAGTTAYCHPLTKEQLVRALLHRFCAVTQSQPFLFLWLWI